MKSAAFIYETIEKFNIEEHTYMGNTATVFYNKAYHAFMFPDDGPYVQAQKMTFYLELVISRSEEMTYLASRHLIEF